MNNRTIRDVLAARYRFSVVPHANSIKGEYWFSKQVDADISGTLCVEYKTNRQTYEISFGVESRKIRTKALRFIDALCLEAGAIELSKTMWTQAPCLTMFSPPQGTRAIPAALTDEDLTSGIFASIEEEIFSRTNSLPDLCSMLLRTDGVFDWGRSASGFRVVYAAAIVDALGANAALFWSSVRSLRTGFLGEHIAVKQTRLSEAEFLDRIAKHFSLGDASCEQDRHD